MPDFTVSSDLDALLIKQTLAEAKTYLGVTANETAITTETTRATAAEGQLDTALSAEITRAGDAEQTNATDIATNVTDIATNVTNIATNATAIATETTRATAAEGQLNTALSAEITRAGTAEQANATNIATNATNIATNDTDIATNATNIATNATAISTETTRALAAEALLAPIASPTFTGDVTAPRVITNEIQCVGNTTGTAQPITYDSKEHRFRDYDQTPSNLMVIKKTDGVPIGKVGINHNDPKCALHVVGGHSTGGMADEALRVVGGGLFTSDNDTALVLAMDTDNTASTSNPIVKIKRDEREASTGNVEEMNLGFVGANSLYTNQTLHAGYIQVEGGRKFEVATGSTPAKRMEVSDTGVGVIGTLDVDGDVKLSDFTSTSRSTGATALNPVQNFQPATDATVTNLCVDTAGNIVRGSQEATWTLNRAQLNALTATKVNLLSSPGSGKCIVVEDSNWLIEVDLTKAAQTTQVMLTCEIASLESIYKVATQITSTNLNDIAGSVKTSNDGAFGMYSRQPQLDKISKFNEPMTLYKTGGAAGDDFPDNFVSVKIKIKYRVWDSTTF